MDIFIFFIISFFLTTPKTVNGYGNRLQPRLNLQNKTLLVGSVNDVLQNVIKLKNRNYEGSGFTFEIINQLALHFNFSYQIVVPEDCAFGRLVKLANGTLSWTGIMKMLVDKKVDIAGALFTKTRERMKAVSFTNTIFEDEIGILMKMPKRKDKSEALLAPFKPQVWLLIIVATISMGLVIYSILRLQSFMLELTNKGRKYRNGVLECLWLVYSGLVKQGVKEMANHDSVRILFATWWIFALVLTAFYTANLTAFLTSPEYKIYSSLKDALNDPKTKWLIENDSALEAALEINNDTTFEELRASRIKGRSETFSDFEEARKKVEKGGYIMLGEMYILNNMVFQSYIEHKRECVLTTGRFRFYKRPIGMPMPHETPFGEDFIKFIEQLRREGFIEKWKNMYFPVLESCLPSSSKTLETQQLGLTVSELSSALFMYVGGLLGSTAVVIAEMTLGKKFKCGKNPNVAGKMEKNTAKST